MGLFGVSETLNFEVPQFVRTLRVIRGRHEALSTPGLVKTVVEDRQCKPPFDRKPIVASIAS